MSHATIEAAAAIVPTIEAAAHAPKVARRTRKAEAIAAAEAIAQGIAAEAAAQEAAQDAAAADVTASWVRAIKAKANVEGILAERAASIFAAFHALGLAAASGDERKASNLRSSMLLCKPAVLAALPPSAHKAIVKATLHTWERFAALAAHPSDEAAQAEGKAVTSAMAASFYGASYRFNVSAIEAAKDAQRKSNQEAAKAKKEAAEAAAATLAEAAALLAGDDAEAAAAHPAAFIVSAFQGIEAGILSRATTAAEAANLAALVLEAAFQLRAKLTEAAAKEAKEGEAAAR